MSKPKVAFVGTGGTIASLGVGPLDLQDYGAAGNVMHADAILARWPETALVADVIAVPYRNIPSTAIDFADWRALVALCDRLVADHPDLAGIVIGHGTATLEETAYVLNLTLKVAVPVVLVGAQRPSSALSSDAGMNLVNAIRVAACPEARGMGVLVVLNDEIQAARDVTKTATLRLQTFRTPDFGVLGHADGDAVAFYRRPLRRCAPDTEFDIRGLEALPRVDIAYAYAGGDGTAVRAFVAAGARGIVSAGFAPGFSPPGDFAALKAAAAEGVVVVQGTRAGSGRTFRNTRLRDAGILIADNLNPQKARILLALALTVTREAGEIEQIFRTY
jgi:L-asparaginase